MDFSFSTLVTNRSQDDLEILRALLAVPMEEWTAAELSRFNQAASRGAYNYTDLNRVTACMDYLNEVLTGMGYVTGYHQIIVHPEAESPAAWLENDAPTQTQLQRYLTNVSALRGVLVLPEDTAEVPESMSGLTLEGANAIERILDTIQGWIKNIQAAWFYSGDLYSGEV